MFGIPHTSFGPGLPRELPPVPAETDPPDATPEALVCGRCREIFDPADMRWNGHAQYRSSGFCCRCVDLCHDSESADHRCPVCTTTGAFA